MGSDAVTRPRAARRSLRTGAGDDRAGAVTQQSASLTAIVDRAQREIALIQEFRTRLIADVVTGKLDARAEAASLPPETAAFEPIDEPAEDEDLDEGIGNDETEDAAA
jgi:type I restriction enzyme S subunit